MTCKCKELMAEDPTRHFRGCPDRDSHPDEPAIDPATTAFRVGFLHGLSGAINVIFAEVEVCPGEALRSFEKCVDAIRKLKP